VPDCAQLSPDPLFPYIYPVQNTSAILLEPLHIQNSCICPAFSTVVAAGCGIAVENHIHMLAIFHMWYNFARIHQTLRVTPAMEAGLSSHVWSIRDIVNVSLFLAHKNAA
jgi:hypothetical protein